MFATVECKDAPGGFSGFVRDIFTLPEITLTRIKIPEGEWFYKVTVTEYRGQIPVEETAQRLKRLKDSVLFEGGYENAERCIALFLPDYLDAQQYRQE